MSYRSKIKSRRELLQIRNELKDKVWVMVHGCFDLVHPGHIRHLRFAKEKGDILVVSITSDHNVDKGEDRPYITQELRAENLAALEIVDYVIIDDNKTPISLIKDLKPNIFVKGVEYEGKLLDSTSKTSEEQRAVEAYGGVLIFSPGDIVFSSTKILETHKPNIENEKLRAMLDGQGIDANYILGILETFRSKKVLVVGDTIVDRYTYCATLGKTTKTPTLSVKYDYSEDFIGGAAIVAQHIREMGGNIGFLTLLGCDEIGERVLKQFQTSDVQLMCIMDKFRPTTLKERFWADNYKLLQVDRVENEPLTGRLLEEFFQKYIKSMIDFDLVVFSDFRHGIFNKETITRFVNIAKKHKKVIIADTQVSNRWGNIADYKGIGLVCPNEAEARFALGDQDIGVLRLGRRLLKETDSDNLILKLGERGIIAFEKPTGSNKDPDKIRDYYPIPSFADQVVDPVGAGDALLAAVSLSMSKDVHLLAVGILANAAAALSLRRMGNVSIKYEDLKNYVEKKLLKDIFG